MPDRLNIHEYHLIIAFAAAARSTCPRRRVGAVLTSDNKVVSTGYNGAPPSTPHCEDVGCLMYGGNCIRPIHAEVNALLRGHGDTLYVTDQPCLACLRTALSAGITQIYYARDYDDTARDRFIAELDLCELMIKLPIPDTSVINASETIN